jgi:PQQ-dependent catabolism-associated CXXCW motif protein
LFALCSVSVSLLTATAAPLADPAFAPEPDTFWTGPIHGPVPATIKGGRVATTADVLALLKDGAIAIDVTNAPRRPENLAPAAPWMPAPHAVLPGSLWIPGVGVAFIPVSLDEYFRARLGELSGDDLDKPVLVYCHERCWLSWNAARRAIDYGYRKVYWYPEGIEGWRAAGRGTAYARAEPVPE